MPPHSQTSHTNILLGAHCSYSNWQWGSLVHLPTPHGLYDLRYAVHHRLNICKPTPRLKKFQASEATLKVPDLCALDTTITGSTDTLSIALTNLPDPTACNYLLCSIEPPLTPGNNFIFLCYNRQYSYYTSNLITSLFPTLDLLYPEIQKTEVWQTPNQHTCISTISELLTSSDTLWHPSFMWFAIMHQRRHQVCLLIFFVRQAVLRTVARQKTTVINLICKCRVPVAFTRHVCNACTICCAWSEWCAMLVLYVMLETNGVQCSYYMLCLKWMVCNACTICYAWNEWCVMLVLYVMLEMNGVQCL